MTIPGFQGLQLPLLLEVGTPGDLGAAAVQAVVEEGRRGNAHAAVGQPAREMELRQDFVAATLVQVRRR